jgi:hypothetical protein
LDLHYPDLKIDHDILVKCKFIFITLLRYIERYEDNDFYTTLWPVRKSFWKEPYIMFTQKNKFKLLFFSEKLRIHCVEPHPFYHDEGSYTIKSLLCNYHKYEDFVNSYHNDDDYYDYYDIFDTIKSISIELNNEIPDELIDKIICLT